MPVWLQNGGVIKQNGGVAKCNDCPCTPIEVTVTSTSIRKATWGSGYTSRYSLSDGSFVENVDCPYPDIPGICAVMNAHYFNDAENYEVSSGLSRMYISDEHADLSSGSNTMIRIYYLKEIYVSHNSVNSKTVQITVKKYNTSTPLIITTLATYTEAIASGATLTLNDVAVFEPIEAPVVEPRTYKSFTEIYVIETEIL